LIVYCVNWCRQVLLHRNHAEYKQSSPRVLSKGSANVHLLHKLYLWIQTVNTRNLCPTHSWLLIWVHVLYNLYLWTKALRALHLLQTVSAPMIYLVRMKRLLSGKGPDGLPCGEGTVNGNTSVIVKAYSALLGAKHPSDAWDAITAAATSDGAFDRLERRYPFRDLGNDFMEQYLQRLRVHWDDV